MNKLLLSTALLALFTTAIAQEKSVTFIEGNVAEAKSQAKAEGRIIFVDAYATWCGPCKWMSANVFTNDTVADFFNANFVNLKLDMEKGEGIEFRKKYGIRYYPTMLFLDAEGNELHRHLGVSKKMEDYIDMGLLGMNPVKRLSAYHTTYKNGERSPVFMMEYLKQLDKVALPTGDVLADYYNAASEEDLMNETSWNLIYNYDKSVDSKGMQSLLKNRQAYSEAYGQDKVDQRLYENYLDHLYSKVYAKDFSMKEMELTMIDVKKKDIPYWEKIILLGDLAHLKQVKNYKDYCEVAVEDIGDYFNDDPNALNEFAWNVFQWSKKKKEWEVALTWAERSLKMEENSPVLDTYANLLYVLGRKEEARTAQQKAIDLIEAKGGDSSEYKKTLDSFK